MKEESKGDFGGNWRNVEKSLWEQKMLAEVFVFTS